MKLQPFSGPGSTPSRRRFWDKITQVVTASQKVSGRHVTIDEHPGKGTVINVDDTSARRPGPPFPPGCCPFRDGTEVTGFDLTYDISASVGGEEGCSAGSFTGSHTFHFVRIPYGTPLDGGAEPKQFWMYIIGPPEPDGHCQLGFTSPNFYPVGISHDFPVSDGVCVGILDRLFGGSGSPPWTYDPDPCRGGTITIWTDESSCLAQVCECVEVAEPHTITPCGGCTPDTYGCGETANQRFCGGIFCGVPNVGEGLVWEPDDLTLLFGTYVTANTCAGDGHSMTVTTTLVIY